MTDIITEIMVEVLGIFRIATKELRRGSASESDWLFVNLHGIARREVREDIGRKDRSGKCNQETR